VVSLLILYLMDRYLAIVFVVVSLAILYLMDRYDVPSLLISRGGIYATKLRLAFKPIIVTDGEIFSAISGSSLCPATFRTTVDGGSYRTLWEEYQKFRVSCAASKVLGDPETIPALLDDLKRRFPGELKKILRQADEYVRDRFNPFGVGTVTLGKDFSWRDFPSRGNDVIYVWELSTLQHLTGLAQAYRLTGNKEYLNTIVRHLSSWMAENPIDNSVNWEAAMEESLRLYSLVWVNGILSGHDGARELSPLLTKAVYGHARAVSERLDKPRKKNNHGILAAMGLYFFAVSYPEFRQSPAWKDYAERRILDELELQYTTAGVHKEYAPAYHKLLLAAYLQYLVTKRKLNEPVPEAILARIKAQLYYLRDVADPTGKVFLIGDSDDHYFLRLAETDFSDVEPTLHLGALLFSLPQLSRPSRAAEWDAKWILGDPLYKKLASSLGAAIPSRPGDDRRLHVYWEEGYFRIDSEDLLLFGDFSRLGGEPHFAGHNHADISSFLLWDKHGPIVIDPGTYTYRSSLSTKGIVWRDFLRSSTAHNTTSADGLSQAAPAGDFGYKTWPNVSLLFATAIGDLFFVGGEHDAYQNHIGRTVRVFLLVGRNLLVVDWFPESAGTHTYETNLVLADQAAQSQGNTVRLKEGKITWLTDAHTEARLLVGSYDPPGGWRSPSYGLLLPTAQIRIRRTVPGPVASAFLITLSGENSGTTEPQELVLDRLASGGYAIRFDGLENSVGVLLNPAKDRGESPVSFGGWSTDAAIAAYEVKPKGRAVAYDGTYLHSPGLESEIHFLKRREPVGCVGFGNH